MNLAPQTMAKEVAATGFSAEPLEKVFRLMALLDALLKWKALNVREHRGLATTPGPEEPA